MNAEENHITQSSTSSSHVQMKTGTAKRMYYLKLQRKFSLDLREDEKCIQEEINSAA